MNTDDQKNGERAEEPSAPSVSSAPAAGQSGAAADLDLHAATGAATVEGTVEGMVEGDPGGARPRSQSLGDALDAGTAPPILPVDGGAAGSGQEAAQRAARRLRFTADGREYFRIWIVNVALTLVTLGIWSAWAKVRARRYLYGHMWLGDAAFDYTANPVAILRGRILVAIAAGVLWFTNLFGIWYYYAAIILAAPIVPWVVIRARSFQLRNSWHSGIAFDFDGKFRDALLWYPLMGAASFLSCGLAWPYRVFGRDRFLVDESRFGNRRFRFTSDGNTYYTVYVLVWILTILLFVGSCMVLVASVPPSVGADEAPPPSPLILPVFVGLAGFASFVYIRTRLLSIRWSATELGETNFRLQLSFGRMLWIYASNAALIVATFGLYAPFARIRLLRYVIGNFLIMQPLGEAAFEAGDAQRLGAAGAEAAGEFGLEIGI